MTANETITSVRGAIAAKKVSARELAADYFKRIAARNGELNAYLTLSEERAYRQADRVDAMVAEGKPLPPMAGVPIAVKDVISTRGIRTTCGSKILSNYIPPYDATAVTRLEAAGAVILGKTNCDEFAMGSSNENSAYGPVQNPHPAACPVARVAVRQPSSRRTSPSLPSEPTPAVRFASQARSAAFPP